MNTYTKSAESILGRQYIRTLKCALQVARFRLNILLRKEVIQPHLPVRLPCYDLALLTDLTFGGSLPCGLGDRLRVLSTQVA